MKTIKMFIFIGMIGIVSFFVLDVLGWFLWKDYNPMTMYISCLTADGAPNLQITRFFYYVYNTCLFIFSVGMCYIAFKYYHTCTKIGYSFLLIAVSMSLVGNGTFPMTVNNIFEKQNVIHLVITVVMFAITAFSLYLLAAGYLRQEKLSRKGYISLTAAIMFTVFNLLLLYVILTGLNITGLAQRFSSYTFFIYLFIVSWLESKAREYRGGRSLN